MTGLPVDKTGINPTSGFYFPMLASNEKRGLFHTS